jgi:hypothetical protein
MWLISGVSELLVEFAHEFGEWFKEDALRFDVFVLAALFGGVVELCAKLCPDGLGGAFGGEGFAELCDEVAVGCVGLCGLVASEGLLECKVVAIKGTELFDETP